MQTIAIGDTHLMAGLILPLVDKYISDVNHIILVGDYTDQWMQTENTNLYIKDLEFLNFWKQKKQSHC